MNAPTILQVLPALQSGGVERGTIEMTQAITAAGGRALVASAGGRLVPLVERAGGLHARMKLMSRDPVTILLNARRLARLIRQERVDLVHARSRAPAWSAWLAAKLTRTPFVTTWHGVYSENLPGKRRYNAVMARGARVIAISRFVAARVAGDYLVPPERLRVIPRGADIGQFDPALVWGERIHRLARDWQLPEDAPVIMLPGRITRWKGHALLVEALARMRDRRAIALFVGAAPDRRSGRRFVRELLDLARRSGVAERVRFAGHCADMPAAFALADLVVVPSLKPEPFGRVVVEAQAMARPVIVARHGAAMETVTDGQTGWTVPPGDVAAWAATLDTVLGFPADDVAAVGEAGRRAVHAGYTTASMQQATLAVYDELLGTRLAACPPAQDEDAMVVAGAAS